MSVVCLSYNHERFIDEAIQSVLSQSYPSIELIIVDDASTDLSAQKIRDIVSSNPTIITLLLDQNLGNCKAFNKGLALAKGDFVIDLAADDVLLPTRVDEGVKALENSGPDYGVNFSDAELIDESGNLLFCHSERFPHNAIPEGRIYMECIRRYFICPPTVMFRREVMDYLGGYDESLSYEDFDFWIRSSRKFKYCYSPKALVKRRMIGNAMARSQFQFFSRHSKTTFQVCEKILKLNQSREEQSALTKRIGYEIRLNLRLLNFRIVWMYILLRRKNKRMSYVH